mmetsp:Transcript_118050/g.208723  ORF Transcript_118050/g.208723 Transcript_118050/m.208723 type:complete len:81 (-) Transcript_118050:17-259(-)
MAEPVLDPFCEMDLLVFEEDLEAFDACTSSSEPLDSEEPERPPDAFGETSEPEEEASDSEPDSESDIVPFQCRVVRPLAG